MDDQPPDGQYGTPPPTVRPGDALTVYGHWYTSTCNDTGGHDPLVPLSPVTLTLTLPGKKTERVGQFTPGGRDMGFKALVSLPAGTPAGRATVSDDRTPYPATYEFTVGE